MNGTSFNNLNTERSDFSDFFGRKSNINDFNSDESLFSNINSGSNSNGDNYNEFNSLLKLIEDEDENEPEKESESKNDYSVDLDKKIDEYQQGRRSDCWMLSALSGLSNTKTGQKLLNDAITINKDSATVNLKGINYSVDVSFEEINKAKNKQVDINSDGKKDTNYYSSGDDDVVLMELAIEKAMNDAKSGKVKVPDEIINNICDNKDVLADGSMNDIIYLLTGDTTKYQFNPYHPINDMGTKPNDVVLNSNINGVCGNDLEYVFDKVENNPESVAANIIFTSTGYDQKSKAIVRDKSGKNEDLTAGFNNHSCSLKSVKGNEISIVNPWDSSKDLVFSKDDIEQYIADIEYYELS